MIPFTEIGSFQLYSDSKKNDPARSKIVPPVKIVTKKYKPNPYTP
jgi:hypothetical protein